MRKQVYKKAFAKAKSKVLSYWPIWSISEMWGRHLESWEHIVSLSALINCAHFINYRARGMTFLGPVSTIIRDIFIKYKIQACYLRKPKTVPSLQEQLSGITYLFCFWFFHHWFNRRFKGKQTCSQVTITIMYSFGIKMATKRKNFDPVILFLN